MEGREALCTTRGEGRMRHYSQQAEEKRERRGGEGREGHDSRKAARRHANKARRETGDTRLAKGRRVMQKTGGGEETRMEAGRRANARASKYNGCKHSSQPFTPRTDLRFLQYIGQRDS